MAAKQSPARSSRSKGTPRRTVQKQPEVQRVRTAARRLASFSRPRSATDFLTLFFVLLTLITVSVLVWTALFRGAPVGSASLWPSVLLACALASRTSPWWRAEVQTLTVERARLYAGSLLLVY